MEGAERSSPLSVQAPLLMFAAAIGWNGVYLAEVARLGPSGRIDSVTGGPLSPTFAGIVPTLLA